MANLSDFLKEAKGQLGLNGIRVVNGLAVPSRVKSVEEWEILCEEYFTEQGYDDPMEEEESPLPEGVKTLERM